MGSVQWADIKFHLFIHIFICIIIPIIINHITPKCVFFGRMQSVLADIKFYVPPSVESLYVTPRKSLFVGFCRTFSAAAQLR